MYKYSYLFFWQFLFVLLIYTTLTIFYSIKQRIFFYKVYIVDLSWVFHPNQPDNLSSWV